VYQHSAEEGAVKKNDYLINLPPGMGGERHSTMKYFKLKYISPACNILIVIFTGLLTYYASEGLKTWRRQSQFQKKMTVIEILDSRSQKMKYYLLSTSEHILEYKVRMHGQIDQTRTRGLPITFHEISRFLKLCPEERLKIKNEVGGLKSLYFEFRSTIDRASNIGLKDGEKLLNYAEKYARQITEFSYFGDLCMITPENIDTEESKLAILRVENIGYFEFILKIMHPSREIKMIVRENFALLDQ
jgi:hypothetical protein